MAKNKKKKERRKLKAVADGITAFSDKMLDAVYAAENKVSSAIEDNFYRNPEGVLPTSVLFRCSLDDLSDKSVERIKKDLQNGAKIMFTSSLGQADAKKALLDLGIEDSFANSVYVVCDNGRRILCGRDGKIAAGQAEVRFVQRDENGNIKLDANGVPITVEDKISRYAFSKEMEDSISKYASKSGLNITQEPTAGTIVVSGGDRNAQIFHAKQLIDSLNLTPEQLKNYGINYTKDGVVIRPYSQSEVNAECTICRFANIPLNNVRRSVSSVGEINPNHTLNNFVNMFVDESNNRISAVEASKSGRLDEIVYNLFDPDLQYVTVSDKTKTGTWFQQWGLSNRKSLLELHRFQQDHSVRVNATITPPDVGFVKKTNDSLEALMGNRFDLVRYKNMKYVSYKKYAEAKQILQQTGKDLASIKEEVKAYNEAAKKAGKNFKKDEELEKLKGALNIAEKYYEQSKLDTETSKNVLNFLSQNQKDFKLKGSRGRISSFLFGVVERDKMKPSNAINFEKFENLRNDTFEQITEFSGYLNGMENANDRADLSLVFTGFMLGLEHKIKKGATQEEILNEIQYFIKTHTKTVQQENTPPSPTPPSSQNPPTPPSPPQDRNDDELAQQMLNQLILKKTIEADQKMINNIEKQYNGDIIKASNDTNFIYFAKQLAAHQMAYDALKLPEGDVQIPNVNNEKLERALQYALTNLYISQNNYTNERLGTTENNIEPFKIPQVVKDSAEYKFVVKVMLDSIMNADIEMNEAHNEILATREKYAKELAVSISDAQVEALFNDETLRSIVENSLNGYENIILETFVKHAEVPNTQEPTPESQPQSQPQPEPEPLPEDIPPQEMIDAFKQFSYVPSVSAEQTDKHFNAKAIKMTNEDLWMFNRYHKIVTTNMEEYLKSRGYTSGALISSIQELNQAFKVIEGLTEAKVTAEYKNKGYLQEFVKAYDDICEKYADNPAVLKQMKEIFLFEMDEAKRLNIYRKSIIEQGKGYTFRGKKAPTQDALLGEALKEDLQKDSGKVLAMIHTASVNVREYNLFKFDVQTSFEATQNQFEKGVLTTPVDYYQLSRSFTGDMLDGMKEYLQKYGKGDTKEFEIFEKLCAAWKVDSSKIFDKTSLSREKELKALAITHKKIMKEYSQNPAELKKAQDMFMVCVGQAKAIGEMFKIDNPSKTWATLAKIDTKEYANRFAEELEIDRDIALQAINTATLISGVNEVKKSASKPVASNSLGVTSGNIHPTGYPVEVPKAQAAKKKKSTAPKTENKKQEKKQTAKKSQPKKQDAKKVAKKQPVMPKPKKQAKPQPAKPEAFVVNEENSRLDVAREQLVLINGISNAKEIMSLIVENYHGDIKAAQQDLMFVDLAQYCKTSEQKLNESITQNSNLSGAAKKDVETVGLIATNKIITQELYNKAVKANLFGSGAKQIKISSNQQLQAFAEDKWKKIVIKQNTNQPLTKEEELLIKNTPMWESYLREYDLQRKNAQAQRMANNATTHTQKSLEDFSNKGQTNEEEKVSTLS